MKDTIQRLRVIVGNMEKMGTEKQDVIFNYNGVDIPCEVSKFGVVTKNKYDLYGEGKCMHYNIVDIYEGGKIGTLKHMIKVFQEIYTVENIKLIEK